MHKIISLCLKGLFLRTLLKRFFSFIEYGSLKFKVDHGLGSKRPHYLWSLYYAASLAKSLNLKSISVLEFGCAGGNGLLELERCAEMIERDLAINIEIYGFDTGEGLPAPQGFRDLPYVWQENQFPMNKVELMPKLKRSKLIFGDVKNTVITFFEKYSPAPVGAIIHDLDYYSSTSNSFQLLKFGAENFLPRVINYFDDIIGNEESFFNDFTGERLAINEFNMLEKNRKFSHAYNLISEPSQQVWYHQIRILHIFDHSKYCQMIANV